MKPFRKNASIIARKNGKFLLVKKPRDRHAWQFPQGGVETGETFLEAARREFLEEIGTDKIEIIGGERGIHFYDWPTTIEIDARLKKFRGQEVHIFVVNFLADDAEIILDKNELESWKWVDRAELAEKIESREYLAKVLAIIDAAE
ncbi:MAG: NUDIX domain-containing protein [Patescibacteria group bacterium]